MSQFSAEARKWFEVPPSGMGSWSRSRAGKSVEQRAIFDGELAGEPVVRGVIEIEPGLHRGEVGGAGAEGMKRVAELAGFGPVLGVVDHDIFAAGERQRVVQRLRLGARRKLRHHDDLEDAWKAERARRRLVALEISQSRWPA